MSDTDNDQKTELPTQKHLADAFEQGQFAKSPEIQVAFTLAAVIGVIGLTATQTARDLVEVTITVFTQLATMRVDSETLPTHITEFVLLIGRLVAPILLASAFAAMLSGGLQTGFRVTGKVLGFKPERLNPVTGFTNLFNKAKLVHAGLDLLKFLAVGFALYGGLRTIAQDPLFSAPIEVAYLGEYLYRTTLAFFTRMLFALAGIAAISYAYEAFKTRRDLMMTREQVKDEGRQSEGDAKMKGAMRRMARRLLQKQMLSAVPTADVVLTNPTHYAVALKYERGLDRAPVVLAKGADQFARRIKALAAEHGVPVVENKPVARLLFGLGKVGEAIPAELYQAVAEILAVVYRTHRYYFHQLKLRRAEASNRAA
ncbi:MAG: EscU/YscU/HrcU family type III secretion system export apparatus switch protein [Opitutae bacterium]|nr:EscU/YscU/HrcU family type III secretion system export apparatus switch protein [Opitutae bacterium]